MNEVIEFLGDVNKPVAFATVDVEGNKPRVRFLSFKMVVNNELYFITSKQKNVYKELEKNNNLEICSMPSPDNSWIRIESKVEFVQNIELNKKAFILLPMLEKAYGTPENEDIVLLKLNSMHIRKYSMAGKVEEILF